MTARSLSLTGRMESFLRAAGRDETPFLRCTRGAAEFGWTTRNGLEVHVEALSGGQACIFRAALAYAVVMARAPEQRLLMVEIAEACDSATEASLLAALLGISCDLQVIVACCVPIAAPEGWTVIDVAAREVAA